MTVTGQTYNRGVAGTPQASSGEVPNQYFVGGYGTALGQIFRRNFPNYYGRVSISATLGNRSAQGDYGIDQLQFRQSQITGQRDTNAIVVDIAARMSALRQARARHSAAVNTLGETLERNQVSLDEGLSGRVARESKAPEVAAGAQQ